MRIDIVSTQIKNGEHVIYTWLDATRVICGDTLKVVLRSGYIPEYKPADYVTFCIKAN